jgi:hypothetical protein
MCGVGVEDRRPSKQACFATNRRAISIARRTAPTSCMCALISVAQSGGRPQQCASVAPAWLGHQPHKTPRDRPTVGYILSTAQRYWPLGQWPPQTRLRAKPRAWPNFLRRSLRPHLIFAWRRSSPRRHLPKLVCLGRVFALRVGWASDDVAQFALRLR